MATQLSSSIGYLEAVAIIDSSGNQISTFGGTISDALPAGDNNIGNVDLASALPAGTNMVGTVGSVITTETVVVNATGSAGSSTGSTASASLMGFILDIKLDYNASAPATTDVTITDTTLGHTILAVANNATDARYVVRNQACDAAAAAISGMYEMPPVNGTVTVAVAGCNQLSPAVTAYIRYLR